MFSTYLGNMVIDHMFRNQAYTSPSAVYVSLHTADPGETGANEVVVGTDADYVRKAITFDDPVAGTGMCLSNAAASWTVAAASAGYTVTHIAIWTLVSAGTFLISGPLLPNRVLIGSQTHSLNIGEVIAAIN